MLDKSQNFKENIPILVAVCAFIIQKLNINQFPISLKDQLVSEDIDDMDKENKDGNSEEKRHINLNKVIKIISENIGYYPDNPSETLLFGYQDRLRLEVNKQKLFADLGENRFNLKDISTIKMNIRVFQDLYHSHLKFSQFDERLFNYNLKGDVSPIKRFPFKSNHFKNIIESKPNNVYRALDFSNFKMPVSSNNLEKGERSDESAKSNFQSLVSI